MGRPTERTDVNRAKILKARSLGLSYRSCAASVGRSEEWLRVWRREEPEFDAALEAAKVTLTSSKAQQIKDSDDPKIALEVLKLHDEDWKPDTNQEIRIVMDLPSLLPAPSLAIDWEALAARLSDAPSNPALPTPDTDESA